MYNANIDQWLIFKDGVGFLSSESTKDNLIITMNKDAFCFDAEKDCIDFMRDWNLFPEYKYLNVAPKEKLNNEHYKYIEKLNELLKTGKIESVSIGPNNVLDIEIEKDFTTWNMSLEFKIIDCGIVTYEQ